MWNEKLQKNKIMFTVSQKTKVELLESATTK